MGSSDQAGIDLAVLRPSAQVICRQLGHGAVLIHLETNQIYELNLAGYRIWELLGEGLHHRDICERIQEEFDVDAGSADRETDKLLETLAAERLIARDPTQYDAASAG